MFIFLAFASLACADTPAVALPVVDVVNDAVDDEEPVERVIDALEDAQAVQETRLEALTAVVGELHGEDAVRAIEAAQVAVGASTTLVDTSAAND